MIGRWRWFIFLPVTRERDDEEINQTYQNDEKLIGLEKLKLELEINQAISIIERSRAGWMDVRELKRWRWWVMGKREGGVQEPDGGFDMDSDKAISRSIRVRGDFFLGKKITDEWNSLNAKAFT